MAVLTVEGIQKSFSGVDVLRDISFSLEKGEALAIIGSSGSGKTTLVKALVNRFGDEAVDYTVSAAGAIMGRHIKKRLGSLKYDCHYFSPPASFLIFSRTSAGVGIIPPVRPKNSTGLLQSIASLTSSII